MTSRIEHNAIWILQAAIICLITLACEPQQESDQAADPPVTTTMYTNPIIKGFYPDPSICRVGEDYYLINSTFAYYPGIPVFHSRDLVNWRQIGNVMDRPEQMNLIGHGVSRGMFAPDINYINGKFYVVCTFVGDYGNFIVSADRPEGPYSNPRIIPEAEGIDPALFQDDDGKTYLIYNSVAPPSGSLYNGHRTIRMYEYNLNTLKVVGEEKILIDGGTDISQQPIWIEGPHILKKDGWYYLIAAEGGTGNNHSEVVFRSKDIWGPYVSYENNPILTQRHLDRGRAHPITSTGHADLVQTQNGDWWGVFLGCRPYTNHDFYNTGRETFMVPVIWQDEWPIFNPDFEEVQYAYPAPDLGNPIDGLDQPPPTSGNFTYHDDFDQEQLDLRWTFLRTVSQSWYETDEAQGTLSIDLRPETCSRTGNPSFIGHRQQHLVGEASTSLDFIPAADNEQAGLVIFQNEGHYYLLSKKRKEGKMSLEVEQSSEDDLISLASWEIPDSLSNNKVNLKIESRGTSYACYYSFEEGSWELLIDDLDAKFLSTQQAGGFVGCFYAMYATSNGQDSESKAIYDWFEYKGNDAIYEDITN